MLLYIYNEERQLEALSYEYPELVSAFDPPSPLEECTPGERTLLVQGLGIQANLNALDVDPPTIEDVEMLYFAQDNHDLAIFGELKDLLEDNVLPYSRGFNLPDHC